MALDDFEVDECVRGIIRSSKPNSSYKLAIGLMLDNKRVTAGTMVCERSIAVEDKDLISLSFQLYKGEEIDEENDYEEFNAYIKVSDIAVPLNVHNDNLKAAEIKYKQLEAK